MEQNIDKLIEEQFKKLPPPLQRAISLTPWRELVTEVVIAYKFDAEKETNLETETMLVIYELEKSNDFVGNITRELQIDNVLAQTIAKVINDKVFKKIIDTASQFLKEKGDTLQTTPNIPTTTQEITPKVVVETAKPENKSPINLIPPPVAEKELKLEAPKPGDSLTSLAPANLPVAQTDKPKNFMDEKLKQVVTAPIKTSSYPGGVDPYREPAN